MPNITDKKPADLSFEKKITVESVQTKNINSAMHMFNVSTLYRQSIKLLHQSCGRSWLAHKGTIHAYTKAIKENNCLSSHSCHFVKNYFFFYQTPSCICSMCLHCIGKVPNCSIKSCGRSWSNHEGTIYAYTNTLLGKNCVVLTAVILSKIIFSEPNSFMHMFNVSTLYRQSIKLFHQKLW